MAHNSMPLHTLVGTREEIFYQLGQIDKKDYLAVSNHISGLIRTPWGKIDQLIQHSLAFAIKQEFTYQKGLKKNLIAYSEGLGTDVEKIALFLLIPEIISSMAKWIPGLPSSIFGCSSYFFWNPKSESLTHGRVLDFPLVGSFDKHQRAVIFKEKNCPTILSYSSAGFPYPSLTAMSDQGITLAIHQKFSDKFNNNGTPIFELLYQLLLNCHNKKSTIDFLNRQSSITSWGIYIGFNNGDVLVCDIVGDQKCIKEYKATPDKILYFNNQYEKKEFRSVDTMPFGNDTFCEMREHIAQKKIEKFLTKKNQTDLGLLKMMTTPLPPTSKLSKNYCLDPITPMSLTTVTMNPKAGLSHNIPGEGAKYFQGNYSTISDIWHNPSVKAEQSNPKPTKNQLRRIKGLSEQGVAQSMYDQRKIVDAYHHIQLSIQHLKDLPEQNISQFYFTIYQFIHDTHQKVRQEILQDFKELRGNLPSYLNDHCLLFIARLEKILKEKSTVKIDDINHKKLRGLYKLEQKIPGIILHKVTATFMNPRIDILDIIYGHAK